ncbi:hypothetical protein M0R72_06560 [Candidatus Pacearchaeota archaeon]|jgi:hypothetical protein|nr:hypothetical protein [Candidatus Pacearchaeota archaeon]
MDIDKRVAEWLGFIVTKDALEHNQYEWFCDNKAYGMWKEFIDWLFSDEGSMAILRAFHKAGYRVVHETILTSTFVHTERYVGNAHYEQGVKARAGSLNAAIREAARRYVKEKP